MIEAFQSFLSDLPFWESLLIKLALTLGSGAVGFLAGRLMFSVVGRLSFVKSGKEAKKNRRKFRWIFVLTGIVVFMLLAVYVVWDTTPAGLIEQPLFEISQGKEIRISNVLGALLIFTLARLGVFYFRKFFVLTGEKSRLAMDQGRRLAIFQIGRYLLYLLAILLIFTSLNINLSVLVASSAALLAISSKLLEDFLFPGLANHLSKENPISRNRLTIVGSVFFLEYRKFST